MSLSQKTRERIDDGTAYFALAFAVIVFDWGLQTGTLTPGTVIDLLDIVTSALESLP